MILLHTGIAKLPTLPISNNSKTIKVFLDANQKVDLRHQIYIEGSRVQSIARQLNSDIKPNCIETNL